MTMPAAEPWSAWKPIGSATTYILSKTGFVVAVVSGSGPYSDKRKQANALKIIRAINAHDALVDALNLAMKHIGKARPPEDDGYETMKACRAALALATAKVEIRKE